jgi:hypothetical protein
VSPTTLPVGGCHRQCSKLGLRLLGEVVRPGMEVVWGGDRARWWRGRGGRGTAGATGGRWALSGAKGGRCRRRRRGGGAGHSQKRSGCHREVAEWGYMAAFGRVTPLAFQSRVVA